MSWNRQDRRHWLMYVYVYFKHPLSSGNQCPYQLFIDILSQSGITLVQHLDWLLTHSIKILIDTQSTVDWQLVNSWQSVDWQSTPNNMSAKISQLLTFSFFLYYFTSVLLCLELGTELKYAQAWVQEFK